MSASEHKLELQIIGAFRLTRSDGSACVGLGKRASALLAMLALAPDLRRSRVWLQEKLWGSRGREQASASLRQALVEIRKALGTDRDCLIGDNTCVALDPDRVFVRHFGGDQIDSSILPENSVLLEGLDIGEEGFEDWLREQRESFRARVRTSRKSVTDPGRTGPVDLSQPYLLLIQREGARQDARGSLADYVLESVATTVRELGVARVVDCRGVGAPGEINGADVVEPYDHRRALSLFAETNLIDGQPATRVRLVDPLTRELVWSATSRHVAEVEPTSAGELRDINQAAMVAVERFLDKARSNKQAEEKASMLCLQGIRFLFTLGKENFDRADRCFRQAFELEPRGVYLAWRAYLRTFLLVERHVTSRKTIAEEAYGFLRRALELDPHNSYVLALGAHVQSIVGRSYVGAFELAERATQLNSANPIGWACLGIAKCYLGRSADGFLDTLHARNIAGTSPFRYQLDALSCIAGSMAGRLDEAIHFGEASHAMAPGFAAPLRYLSALYFHRRKDAETELMIEKMRLLEPDFTLKHLLDTDYPAAGLRRTPFLDRLTSKSI